MARSSTVCAAAPPRFIVEAEADPVARCFPGLNVQTLAAEAGCDLLVYRY
jgi:hypothetical protein